MVPYLGGLDHPLQLAHAGDASKRLFVVEQPGVIRVVRDGKLLKRPFLDIRDRVKYGGEMGLLGLAFHPRFKENGRFFVDYVSKRGGLHTVIAEFSAPKGADAADPGNEFNLMMINQPYGNHKGGQLAFGPDGFLYIAMGDGGSGDDPHNNGQRLDTWLGKILRIDVDQRYSGRAYGIPADNPFPAGLQDGEGGLMEIYAWGLRNPWRFSFDPVTGLLYAGDVGQDHWEEIDVVEKGKNYGWRVMEGSHCTPGVRLDCSNEGYAPPILDYGHKEGICVIGGFVYRGHEVPALCGTYVFGDYGNGRVWGLLYDPAAKQVLRRRLIAASGRHISSFGVDEDRELYLVDLDGEVLKFAPKTAR